MSRLFPRHAEPAGSIARSARGSALQPAGRCAVTPGGRSSCVPAWRSALLLALLAATGLSSLACGRGEEPPAAPAPLSVGPEDVTRVVQARLTAGPSLAGALTARRTATVRSQVTGPVVEVRAEQGQRVSRGDVLVRVDTAGIADAATSARLGVVSARANLEVARRQEERQRALLAAGAVSQREVEAAAQAAESARAAVAQAEAQLAAAQKQLASTAARAPFDGVVSERPVSIGDVVQPGTELVTVIDPSLLQLEATIPAEQLGRVSVGQPLQFTVDGYPGRAFEGTVARINPAADPATRQVRVYAELPNPAGALQPLVAGLYAEGRIATQSRVALTAPGEAIDRRLGRPAVLRVRDGKVERVEVALGLSDPRADRVELRSGVAAGDVLLVGPAREITPGTAVLLTAGDRRGAPVARDAPAAGASAS